MELVQIAQRAEDLERATRFYSRLLGSEPVASFDPPGLVFFSLGSTRLLLDRGAPSALIYLRVPSVRAAIEELRAEGMEVTSEPHVIFQHDTDALGPAGHDVWMGFITDTEGNLVGLVSWESSEG